MNNKDNDMIQKSAGIGQQALEQLIEWFGYGTFKINLITKDIRLTPNTAKLNGFSSAAERPNNEETKDSLIYDDDRDLVNGSIYSIISGQSDHYHIEYRMRRMDSSIVWVEEVGFISEYTDDGQPLYMSAMAVDLSRLKWAEEKARDMELKVKRLAAGSDAPSLAEENRILRAANAAATMLIGGFHQDYDTILQQALQMLGESIQANFTCIWRNTGPDGALCCRMSSFWSKNARSIDKENSVLYYTDNDHVSFPYDDFFPEWREALSEDHYIVLDKNSLDENRLSREFIDTYHMDDANSILLAPLYLHGDFWGMIGFARQEDMPFTACEAETMMSGGMLIACSISRSETFGKINLDREKAMANTMAKGEFLSRMSHEMRTPLNAIIGMTDIALRETNPQKINEYLNKVAASSHQMLNVVNDVLDMSKIEAGKLEIVKEPFDFIRMLKDAENTVKIKMDEKQQRFTVNCDESIARKVISDEHRLLQVIINLLNNAMKFTPENGEITLTAIQKRIDDNRVKLRVEVSDNGIGISPQQAERLFNAFEQADGSITRQYGGTGLGLAICKEIMLALGGDIWVISKPNQGSCFFFELETELGEPLSMPSLSAHNAVDQPSPALDDKISDNVNVTSEVTDTSHDWRGRTILLAEDVDINREIVEIMLADTGVNIVSVDNGKDAVEKFCAGMEQYDLILMDIQMPVLDGLSATRQIRSMDNLYTKKIPIIAMTANAFKEDIDICIDAGMNEHIAKPISFDSFFDLLAKYLK